MPESARRTRVEICEGLRARQDEIEQAVLARIYGIADPHEVADVTYLEGLRAAVGVALDYGLSGIESGDRGLAPVSSVIRAQVRLAARNRVSLDIVLRRCFAGYALLSDFAVDEAQATTRVGEKELKQLLRYQAALFDRLLAVVSEEHFGESERLQATSTQRRAQQVERLLAGELFDPLELAYDLDGWHLGVVATGPDANRVLRRLAKDFDARSLLIERDGGIVWAWLGSRRPTDPEDFLDSLRIVSSESLALACGEPGQGIAGWRLSHLQAAAALPLARASAGRLVRYADNALLASILRDDLLTTSMRRLFLEPLAAQGSDTGEVLRETARAYFAAGRNVSSAAAALGVNRHTVSHRLRTVEECVGRPLSSCAPELEAALRLEEVDGLSLSAGPPAA